MKSIKTIKVFASVLVFLMAFLFLMLSGKTIVDQQYTGSLNSISVGSGFFLAMGAVLVIGALLIFVFHINEKK
jgi:hypothetical protein